MSFKVFPKGINIMGHAKGDFGVSEHLRQVAHALNTQGIPFCVVNFDNTGDHSVTNREMDDHITKTGQYKINLLCNNANYVIEFAKTYPGGLALKNLYSIGYGYWELSEFPVEWHEQNKYLKEIWAPSLFIKQVIEKKSTIPVHYMPIAVDFNQPTGFTRESFHLPTNTFIYLFTFDLNSYIARKNPKAAIQAFAQAFPVTKNDSVSLVIKLNRVKHNPEQSYQYDDLLNQIKIDPRIIVIDEILPRISILGLISVCDAYISLHRSEGFGLGMAEAMKMGKVVIGTNYSGNTDFMNDRNSCLINYQLIPVKPAEYVHVESGAIWADPDINHAAYWMKRIYNDPIFAKEIGKNAKKYIDETRNFKVIGENYLKRYKEIIAINK